MVENAVLDAVDSLNEEIISFTQELVRIPSVYPPGDETGVASALKHKMEEIGIDNIRVLAKEPHRPNVLGTLKGGNGKTLALNGHMDTKEVSPSEAEIWVVDPFKAEIVDGKLYGRGSADMKGAIAAMIMAVKAINDADVRLNGDVELVFVAGEEGSPQYGSKYLTETNSFKADAMIIGEPSGIERGWDCLDIACRGGFFFKVNVYGDQMHSSMSDIKGAVNSSVKLGAVIKAMSERLRFSFKENSLYPQGPTINLGVMMSGGVFYGIYPGKSSFSSDVRVLPGMDEETMNREVESLLDELREEDDELKVELEFERELNFVPAYQISREEDVVKASIDAAASVLAPAQQPTISGIPGGTDAIYFKGLGFPIIPAFGPGLLHHCHGPNEYVPVKELVEAAKIYALTAMNYLGYES